VLPGPVTVLHVTWRDPVLGIKPMPWQGLAHECWNRGVTGNRLTSRLAGRLAGRVQAPNLPWAAQVVSWMDLVDLCRELDDGLVTAETSSAEARSRMVAVEKP
jgi:hypothetical protein